MKKQNNILKFLYITFACIFCNACADDDIYTPTHVKEGIPVEINLGLSIPGMDKITSRALPEKEESRINDLYVLVFDATSGNLKTGKFYSTDEIISTLENKGEGTLNLKTSSGVCRIYAVANVETNELSAIRSQLDQVSNIDDLFKVYCSISEANIERVQGSLVMSGAFRRTNESEVKPEGYCVIPEEGGTISSGKIELTRLDSHIKFKISTGPKVLSFVPTSWQVKEVPLKSKIIEQTTSSFNEKSDYGNSKVSTGFGTENESNKSFRTFDFYMTENIKNAKEYEGSSISRNVSGMSNEEKIKEYAKREAEIKNQDGTNTGIYKYSEPHATFVEIKGELEIKRDDNNAGKRVATVTYRIHLGGGIDNPANFTSKRNTKYTYEMTINDVEDIVVEVLEQTENRPGAEGNVIDADSDVRVLDAHYNYFVMGFSYNNVVDEKTGGTGLKFVVRTPFGEVTDKSTPDNANSPAKQDYHWIHFISNASNSATQLETYKKNNVIDLFGLSNSVQERYNKDASSDKTKDKLYYYTVFVDEYYYTEAPKGQNWGSDAKTYWRHFANADNRYVMLVYSPTYSPDGNSSYASAKYMLTQRSIQTYYSTESTTALGMEHSNETGAATWGSPEVSDLSAANGLWNTWEYLRKKTSWNTYVNVTSWDQKMSTFATRNDAIALARCLSRNRDENGDGTISLNEVKWYVPSSEQLMGMYLGAKSLPSPLFDADNITFVYDDRENYHYVTSDKKRIWSEEGASVGDYSVNNAKLPRNFRCVRNLGIDKTTKQTTVDKTKDLPQQAYEYKSTGTRVKVYTTSGDETITANNIFKMSRLTDLNIRGRIRIGEIAIHHNFEDGNKPYKAFQMSANPHSPASNRIGGTTVRDGDNSFTLTTWDVVMRSYWYKTANNINYLTTDGDRSLCKNYSEKADKSDRGLWRAPNQREMMLMYIQNKDNTNNTLARTYWNYEGGERFFCANRNLYLSNKVDKTAKFKIRCVRDVEIE
ncbi:fimbrial protein [Bacteroides sp. GM023]|uniref:fimbrial protein n=1 Tax=Bacteroides sp. GM023 TaxID=2723058 RepID=UPI00168B836C|nr:fimbrial protein [Bacteroides sp. GM023]MBD3591381.1 DUF4906 domain-containing protein [Bacteroides sp. GM023]